MTFSSSDGWPLTGPNDRVSRWPLISVPRTNVRSRRATPVAAQVYLYMRSQRSERTTIASVVARPIDRTSQTSWTSARPRSVLPIVWITRFCGNRSISSRLIPPSNPTAGRSTWSVRRPARTWATWASSRTPT